LRKRYKISIALVVLLVVLPALLLVIAVQSGALRSFIVSRINGLVPAGIPLQVSIGGISGPYYNGMIFHNIVATDENHPADTLLFAGRISLAYSALDLWQGHWLFKKADIHKLQVVLPADSTLASWREALAEERSETKRSGFELALDTVTIVDADIRARENNRYRVGKIKLTGGIRLASGQLEVKIREADFSFPGFDLSPVRLSFAGRTNEAGWSVDSFSLFTPQSAVRVSGQIGRGGQLRITTDPLSLEELSRVMGFSLKGHARYDGHVALDSSGTLCGAGALSGEIEDRVVEDLDLSFTYRNKRFEFSQLRGTALAAEFAGQGFLDLSNRPEAYGYTGRVRGFDLNHVAFNTFSSNLSGHLSMNGRGLTERGLRLKFDLNLGDGRFDEYTFDSAAGHLDVTTEATVFGDDFSVVYKNTDLRFSGFVEYDDSVDIFANVYFHDLSDFEGQTFIDSLDGHGYAFLNLIGETESPAIIGQFESDALRVFDLYTGQFYGRYNIPHVFDYRGGWANLSWGESVGWSLPLDSLNARLRFSGTEVYIDSACAFFPGLSLCSNGWLDWKENTIPVHLDDFVGNFEDQTFRAVDTIRFAIDTVGFTFEPFTISGVVGRLQAEGNISFDTHLDVHLQVDSFRFDPYWRRIFPNVSLTGLVQLAADLGGDFDRPTIEGSGATTELVFDGQHIGDFNSSFSYADRQLLVDSLTLSHAEWFLTGRGVFPVDLAFTEVDQRILDAPQDFRVTGAGRALDPIVWYMPDVVESVRGPWELSVQLTGTPTRPRFGGSGRLTDGRLKTVELANVIENLDVDLEFRHDTIRVVNATGRIDGGRTKGKITANGTITVESFDTYVYDLRLTGEEIPARFEFEDYSVTANVDLSISGSTPPRVSGSIWVLKGEDREPFTFEDEYELPDSAVWDWDISLVCPGNYWIRNEQVSAELNFDLRLLRERGIVSMLGNAEIVPGRSKVYVFDRVGRVEKGELVFDEPGSSDPRLDLELSFRIPSAKAGGANGGEESEYARDVDLTLLVSGRASEPLIRAAQGSPYSDQDILLLLAANRPAVMDTVTSESNIYLDRIQFAATGLLFSQLERMMARAIGLETISLETGSSAAETELTVGTYFLRNFYIYGTSPVALDRGQEVGFEYRFKRGLYLDGRRDKNNFYRLNLHLNWEY